MAGRKTVRVKGYVRSAPAKKKPKPKAAPKKGPQYGSQPHQRLPTREEAARMRASRNKPTGGLG